LPRLQALLKPLYRLHSRVNNLRFDLIFHLNFVRFFGLLLNIFIHLSLITSPILINTDQVPDQAMPKCGQPFLLLVIPATCRLSHWLEMNRCMYRLCSSYTTLKPLRSGSHNESTHIMAAHALRFKLYHYKHTYHKYSSNLENIHTNTA